MYILTFFHFLVCFRNLLKIVYEMCNFFALRLKWVTNKSIILIFYLQEIVSEIPDASTRHIADQIAHSLSFRKNRLWSRERQCQSENLNFLSHRSAFLLHQYLPTILKIKQNKT